MSRRSANGKDPPIDISTYNDRRDLAPREEYEFTILRVPLAEYKPAASYRLPKWVVRWVVVLQLLLFGVILSFGIGGTQGSICGPVWLVIVGIPAVLWAREG